MDGVLAFLTIAFPIAGSSVSVALLLVARVMVDLSDVVESVGGLCDDG